MTDPSKVQWKAERATFHELEKSLNKFAKEGWSMTHMFPPISKDQGFTVVFKKEPPKPTASKTMGFSG